MEPTEARALLGEAVFLDVREPYEFAAGHIAGSLHIPIGQVAARLAEVPPDRPIVVVCQIGQRSALVADMLRARGFDAHNLEGGLARWTGEGLSLDGDSGAGRVVDGYARDLTGELLARRTEPSS